ncbi:MAG: hypothetical protein IPL08_21410 [Saprospiraceae bacterium]|nr:hypothetical protein [Saprospiraceae bacterium]
MTEENSGKMALQMGLQQLEFCNMKWVVCLQIEFARPIIGVSRPFEIITKNKKHI